MHELRLTFRKFFKTPFIFVDGTFLLQVSFHPVAEMVLELLQLGVQLVYGKMVDIVFGSCHSFIFLHSRCSGEFALGLAKTRESDVEAIEAST
jgi:hypothetical protein